MIFWDVWEFWDWVDVEDQEIVVMTDFFDETFEFNIWRWLVSAEELIRTPNIKYQES